MERCPFRALLSLCWWGLLPAGQLECDPVEWVSALWSGSLLCGVGLCFALCLRRQAVCWKTDTTLLPGPSLTVQLAGSVSFTGLPVF